MLLTDRAARIDSESSKGGQATKTTERKHDAGSVSARHGSLQPGDQQLIEEKAIKLRRLYDRVNAIEVTVDLEHLDKPEVEIQVSVEHSENCVAKANASTVIAALDTVIPKVEQQLRRLKEKKTGHRATGHKHIETPVVENEE